MLNGDQMKMHCVPHDVDNSMNLTAHFRRSILDVTDSILAVTYAGNENVEQYSSILAYAKGLLNKFPLICKPYDVSFC